MVQKLDEVDHGRRKMSEILPKSTNQNSLEMTDLHASKLDLENPGKLGSLPKNNHVNVNASAQSPNKLFSCQLPRNYYLIATVLLSLALLGLIVTCLKNHQDLEKSRKLVDDLQTMVNGTTREVARLHKDIGEYSLKENVTRLTMDNKTNQINALIDTNQKLKNHVDEKERQFNWLWGHVSKDGIVSELHQAINQKDEDKVKLLADIGADVNGRDKQSQTPLMLAAVVKDKNVSLRIIKILLEHGANPNFQDKDGQTFFHKLVSGEEPLNPQQFNNITGYLISKNMLSMFTVPESKFGDSPLMWAVEHLEIDNTTLTLLHENGVDFNIQDEYGNTVLTDAIVGHRTENLLAQLVLFGADWKHLNKDGDNMLHWAAGTNNAIALKYLLGLGLQVNGVNSKGWTALHNVCRYAKGNVEEVIKILIKHGADVNIKGKQGETPLYLLQENPELTDTDKTAQLLDQH